MVLAPGSQLRILPILLSAHPGFSGCHWQAEALQKRPNLLVAAFLHNFPHSLQVQQLNSKTVKGHKQIFQFRPIFVWHLVSDSACYFQNCDIFIEVQSFCFYCTQGSIHRPSCHTPSPPEPIVLILYCQFRGRNYTIVNDNDNLSCQLYQLSSSSARPATRLDYSLKHQMFRYLGVIWRKPGEPQAKQGLDPFRINL